MQADNAAPNFLAVASVCRLSSTPSVGASAPGGLLVCGENALELIFSFSYRFLIIEEAIVFECL